MENPADGKICRVICTDVGRLTGAACAVIVRVEHLPPSDVSLSERTDLRNSVCKAVRSRTAPGQSWSLVAQVWLTAVLGCARGTGIGEHRDVMDSIRYQVQ